MTREEIKEHCKKQIETCEMWAKARGENPCGKIYEEHKMILELLEQEPCEDCVSRQGVAEVLLKYAHSTEGKAFAEFLVSQINDLPPVTPQPKIGHWVVYSELNGEWEGTKKYACDKCGKKVGVFKSNFCPNCGAKMEVE